ncbi:Lrp/AsnC family transcriptional regulator [Caulobacter soli]|uniref:Lrp/AsnC family transcriptional regulator n=1 Tax=Caulobacter soli TaxID=2708539 RepID=UPI0013EDE894|nr:Lrp/AsnC family transcriptional regulator [Caulobacter soli]
MTTRRKLDPIDLRILKALSRDGRIAWSELADEVGLSTSPTLRRVRLMEEEGIIKGYAARLDETRLIGEIPVFVSVTLERQVRDVLARFEAAVSILPEVMGGYLMSGSQDYMLHAFVRDLAHYRDLLDRLTEMEGIAHIQSSFVLKSFLSRTAPLLGDTAA